MATQQQGVWGIDVGQCALKALRVEVADGQVKATHFDFVEHPKILSQPDADPDQLTREALEKFLSRNVLKGDVVAMSVPGQSGLARFVKLPPVEEKKISDIVRFEAKQQIPFPLDEVVWDFQKLGSGMVTDGFAMETEIGLFAMKRDMISRFLTHFQDVHVEIHVVQMAPLALCNYLAYDLLNKEGTVGQNPPTEKSNKQECVVALDIGADNSNLVITDGERIIWQRPIPLGGNHFTRSLTKDLKLTFAKAEHLKRNAAKSPDLKKILTALKPVLNDFVGEVQRSLGYFTSTHRTAEVLYMVGLGSAFKLPGLQKYLSEKLQMEVRKPSKFERLVGDDVLSKPNFGENVLSFAVSYGLALQGLKIARLQTNLLPNDIRVARMVRAKKPWAVGAAASLLLGCSMMALGYGCQKNSYASPLIDDALKRGDEVMGTVNEWNGKAGTKEGEIASHAKDVNEIVAGQEEQLNWIEFNKFVNSCLPRPDGKDPTPEQKKYLSGAFRGDLAYEKYVERQAGKLPPDNTDELDQLMAVNIEALNLMYCDDLSAFIKRLQNGIKRADLSTMKPEDRGREPSGKGWVVEMRGYTYHKDRRQFVIDALVKSIAAKSVKPPEVPAPTTTIPVAPVAPATPSAVPMAETNPATPPMVPATPTTANATPPKPPREPVRGLVSHVVLYKYLPVEYPTPGVFELIGVSELPMLATGTGGLGGSRDSGGPMGGMFPMAGPPLGDMSGMNPNVNIRPWAPLGGTVLGGGTASMSPDGMNPMGMVPMVVPPMAVVPGAQPMDGMVQPVKPGAKKAQYTRTEFIIVFIWNEPLGPSQDGSAVEP